MICTSKNCETSQFALSLDPLAASKGRWQNTPPQHGGKNAEGHRASPQGKKRNSLVQWPWLRNRLIGGSHQKNLWPMFQGDVRRYRLHFRILEFPLISVLVQVVCIVGPICPMSHAQKMVRMNPPWTQEHRCNLPRKFWAHCLHEVIIHIFSNGYLF